jgi:two-component system, LuxR family, sensor kinase FixL
VSTAERPSGMVEVCVSDSGSGVAPEHRKNLFEPFFSTKREGMGLGLSISRSIVSAHGGRIWPECSLAGTTFRFSIPVAAATNTGPIEPRQHAVLQEGGAVVSEPLRSGS